MATSTTSTPAVEPHLQRTVFGFMAAKLVYAAVELRLADLLAERPCSAVQLAEQTSTDTASLRRLLRALAGIGIVRQSGADRFELTELGDPLRGDAPGSMQALVSMLCGPQDWRSWGELVGAIRTGESGFERAHGVTWVDYYEQNPEPAAVFHRAMAEHTRDAAAGIVAGADLGRFGTVADVGGGDGTLLAQALRTHPGLEGIVTDLPTGLEGAASTLAAADVEERCRTVASDFFESVPGGADAYLLKQVLHDWDDEAALAILRNVRAALPPEGRVLIVERVLPELAGAQAAQPLLLDMLMLVITGGRERTESDFRGLLESAGFELSRLAGPLPPFDYSIVEGTPRPLG